MSEINVLNRGAKYAHASVGSLQQFEGNVIYPRVVGSSIGLPAIWVLTAVKVGGGYLGSAAYAAAKAGVISLTKSIAKEGSSKNIYCNSLCPAYTKTPLVSILTGEKEQKVLDAMSLHRAADPMEVASAVLFLASDAASFVQGENLNCDGGMLMNG